MGLQQAAEDRAFVALSLSLLLLLLLLLFLLLLLLLFLLLLFLFLFLLVVIVVLGLFCCAWLSCLGSRVCSIVVTCRLSSHAQRICPSRMMADYALWPSVKQYLVAFSSSSLAHYNHNIFGHALSFAPSFIVDFLIYISFRRLRPWTMLLVCSECFEEPDPFLDF
jgi:hypothetical protein